MTKPLTRDELDALREGWDFEAKRAGGRDGGGAVPASFWDTYSAMANCDGGYVALGVRELADGRLEFRGVPDPERLEVQLNDQLNDRHKVSVNLLGRGDIQRLREGERTVVVVRVPRATRVQRPVYLGRDPFSQSKHAGAYIRGHEGDRRLPLGRVKRMFADAQVDHPPDAAVPENYGENDLHNDSVDAYRNMFASQRRDHPFLSGDRTEFLRTIGAWKRDRDSGHEGPTVAGLLMLGREASIRDYFPHFHLSYREVDESASTRWTDRVHPDGTWNANLFQFYLRAIRKLHAGLKVPFALDPDLFRVDETPVHEALREVLVNALVHADYAGRSGVRILSRSGGFETRNPGGLLVPADQLWRGGVSEPRNPTLHRLFAQLRLGEREGSGGPKICAAWREQHWRMPSISETELGETHLVLSNESLLPSDALAQLEGRFRGHFQELDEGGRVVMATALVEGSATHARFVEATGMHSRDITLLLQKLRGWRMLERVGTRRDSPYRIPATRVSAPNASSEHRNASSDHRLASPDHFDPSSDHKPASPDHFGPGSDQSEVESAVTHPLVERVRGSGWAPRASVEAAVLAACGGTFRTLHELSAMLNRTPTTLRARYVRALVVRGQLVLRHPDTPSHPDQAYRTAAEEPEV